MGIVLSSTCVEEYRTLHLDNADVLPPSGTGNTTVEPSCRMLLYCFSFSFGWSIFKNKETEGTKRPERIQHGSVQLLSFAAAPGILLSEW